MTEGNFTVLTSESIKPVTESIKPVTDMQGIFEGIKATSQNISHRPQSDYALYL